MTDHSSFGPELRRARERRGLALEEIAETTKVNVALFRGLENNDVSRWPSGLFRRAFIRSYAQAVGLDPEDTCRRFVRFFPEEGDTVPEMRAVPPPAAAAPLQPVAPAGPPADEETPRLVLAAVPPPGRSGLSAWSRLAAALVDLALGVLAGGLAGWLTVALLGPGWFWPVAAGVAALGHLLALPLLGRTPGSWWLLREPPASTEGQAAPSARPKGPEGPVLVASRREPGRSASTNRSAARRQGRR